MAKERLFLVTGATGFLGSAICRELNKKGEKVRGLVLANDKSAAFLPKNVEVYYGDILDKASLEKFFDVDKTKNIVVIHTASIVTTNPRFNQKVVDVNVNGTENIISLCLKTINFEKLVYVGSTGAILEAPIGTPIKETSFFYPDKLTDCYSKTKALASEKVLEAVKNNNLNATIIYPTGILGPEDFAMGETTRTVVKIIKGEMPLGIDGSFNLVDVRDLAKGCIAAVDKGRKGEGYILGNDIVKFKEFSSLISKSIKCKAPKYFISCSLAYRIASIAEKRAQRTGKMPLMTTFAVYNLARNNVFDSTKAKRELGYTTRPYQETIKDEIEWLKKYGKIN